MPISAVLNVTIGVIRKHGISETIPVSIGSRVVAPVVSAEVGSADDVRPARLRDVPLVGAIIEGVIRVVEVVVVDQVAARRVQVDAVAAVRACGVARERVVVARRVQHDAPVAVRSCGVARERVVVARRVQHDAVPVVRACGVARERVVVARNV
ncbi:MAG: hypothetical protein C5S49_04080 [Candidatus Methanogaster sp.]|nr:MAG: hypothetical protein C5S49_04080 [ANME-2 cluster archaeon]